VSHSSWLISDTAYTTTSDTVITIPVASSGMVRTDILVGNTSNAIVRIAGTESLGISVRPAVPLNTVLITEISVDDATIDEPTTPISGVDFIKKIEKMKIINSTSGVVDIHFTDERSIMSFVGTVTEIKSAQIVNLYGGKKFTLRNDQAGDITIKHLSFDGGQDVLFKFPNEADFILKPKEIIEFLADKESGMFLRYVGGISENAVESVNGQTGIIVLDKNDIGLGDVDNTSDEDKPVSTAQAAADAATLASANAYSDGLVVGLWDDRGNFDASVNAYPTSGGSGSAGAILKGDTWTISVAGTLPTAQVVAVGYVIRALTNTPGNTQANWAIQKNGIGYTAENSANKSDTMSGNTASSIIYLSAKGVYDWATSVFQTIATLSASVLAVTLSGLSASSGTFTSSDTILVAFNKIKYLIDNIATTYAAIASPTFTGTVTTPAIIVSGETASRLAYLDASKNLKAADTGTYPSLAELAYGKGVTSAIQTQIDSKENTVSGVVASGTNTYTASYTPTVAYTDGLKIVVRFTNANSGASTININSLGAKSIVKGVSTALASGDIAAGATLILVYDGSNFVAVSGITVAASSVPLFATDGMFNMEIANFSSILRTGAVQGNTVVGSYANVAVPNTAFCMLNTSVNSAGTAGSWAYHYATYYMYDSANVKLLHESYFGILNTGALTDSRSFNGFVYPNVTINNRDPSDFAYIGFGNDAADTNLQLIYVTSGTGSGGTRTKINLGSSFPARYTIGQNFYKCIIWLKGGNKFEAFLINTVTGATYASGEIASTYNNVLEHVYGHYLSNNTQAVIVKNGFVSNVNRAKYGYS